MLHHREFNVKIKTLFKHGSQEVGFGLGEGIDSAHSAVRTVSFTWFIASPPHTFYGDQVQIPEFKEISS